MNFFDRYLLFRKAVNYVSFIAFLLVFWPPNFASVFASDQRPREKARNIVIFKNVHSHNF